MGCLIALVFALILMYLSTNMAQDLGVVDDDEVDLDDLRRLGKLGSVVLEVDTQPNSFGLQASHTSNGGKAEVHVDYDFKNNDLFAGGSFAHTTDGRNSFNGHVDYYLESQQFTAGISATHTWNNGQDSVQTSFNIDSRNGPSVDVLFVLHPVLNMRRQWKVEPHADLNSIGLEGSRTWNGGHTNVKGSVNHNHRNHNTVLGVGSQHTLKDSRFSVEGYVNRNLGRHSQTSAGVGFGSKFARLDLERLVDPSSVGFRNYHSWNTRLLPKRWLDYEPATLWFIFQ